MRRAKPYAADPLQDIDEMLSALCGKQSPQHDIHNADIDDFQVKPDLEGFKGENSEEGTTNAAEMLTTPEKSTKSRDHRHRRTQTRKQANSNVTERRLQSRNRIRKSKKGKGKQRQGHGNKSKAVAPLDFDGAGQRGREPLGTSSDDHENMNFLHQIKRLAKEQLDVHKRKNNALNDKALNEMKYLTDQCEEKIKQIAGTVSSQIIQRATQIQQALPSKLSEQTSSAMNAVTGEKDGISHFVLEAKAFEDQVNKVVRQLDVQRAKCKEEHDAEEKEIYGRAKKVCNSGQRLTTALHEIDGIIDVVHSKVK